MRSTGADGLAVVAALATGTPVVASGTVSSRTLTASTVLAGTSVPWANGDVVNGVVTARSGNTLTVKGADIDFCRRHTCVSRRLHGAGRRRHAGERARFRSRLTRNKDSISVGQRIVAFGKMSGTSTLDATAGRVRMEITRLTGSVLQLESA